MIVCLSVQSNADEAVDSNQDMNSTEARLQDTNARIYEDTAGFDCITSRELATLLMTEWYEPFDPLFGALAGNFVAGMGWLVGRHQPPGNEEPAASSWPFHFLEPR